MTSKNLLRLVPTSKPGISQIGYAQILPLARDERGLETHEVETLQRFAEVNHIPFLAGKQAENMVRTLPAHADALDQQQEALATRCVTIAKALVIIGAIVALVGLFFWAGNWAPKLADVFIALGKFLWKLVPSIVAVVLTAAVFYGLREGVLAYQIRRSAILAARAAKLRERAQEAEQIASVLRQVS